MSPPTRIHTELLIRSQPPKRALAPDQFSAIDTVSRANADNQAQSATFCPETKKKKKSILSKIGKAGRNRGLRPAYRAVLK